MDDYYKALINEAKKYEGTKVDTVYFGGGTPTVFTGIEKLVSEILHLFDVKEGAEITIEANPGTVNEEMLKKLLAAGINRLSLGVQSMNDDELQLLGRIHTKEQATEAFLAARNAGFKNISVDLMFGIPKQTIESWDYTLNCVKELSPQHISAYSLILEEGTPFWNMDNDFPDEDIERQMYQMLIEKFSDYKHYEISNFAKDGSFSRHNTKYWTGEPYIGLGAGAHSYFDSKRIANVKGIQNYINGEKNTLLETISKEDALKEKFMLGFRLIDGFCDEGEFKNEIDDLIKQGLVLRDGNKVKLSRLGLDFANKVFMEFI